MTTPVLVLLGVLAPVWCLAAGLFIAAYRRHNAIHHKAMHSNVLALMADYAGDGDRSNNDNREPKNTHGASPN